MSQKEYPYNLPLDEDICSICGQKTVFDEEWTPDDAVEDYELQVINAELIRINTGEEPTKIGDGKPHVTCGTCYNMLMHWTAPTKIFLKGLVKLGFINKKYYRKVKRKYGL